MAAGPPQHAVRYTLIIPGRTRYPSDPPEKRSPQPANLDVSVAKALLDFKATQQPGKNDTFAGSASTYPEQQPLRSASHTDLGSEGSQFANPARSAISHSDEFGSSTGSRATSSALDPSEGSKNMAQKHALRFNEIAKGYGLECVLRVSDCPSTPGVFRIPGQIYAVNALYDHYASQMRSAAEEESKVHESVGYALLPQGDLVYNVHDVASVFKKFLWDLPGGILGSKCLFDVLQNISTFSFQGREQREWHTVRPRLVALAFLSIRSSRRIALCCAVFGLLASIKHEESYVQNEPPGSFHKRQSPSQEYMSSRALAVVFAPILLGKLCDDRSTKKKGAKRERSITGHFWSPKKSNSSNVGQQSIIDASLEKSQMEAKVVEMLLNDWEAIVRQMSRQHSSLRSTSTLSQPSDGRKLDRHAWHAGKPTKLTTVEVCDPLKRRDSFRPPHVLLANETGTRESLSCSFTSRSQPLLGTASCPPGEPAEHDPLVEEVLASDANTKLSHSVSEPRWPLFQAHDHLSVGTDYSLAWWEDTCKKGNSTSNILAPNRTSSAKLENPDKNSLADGSFRSSNTNSKKSQTMSRFYCHDTKISQSDTATSISMPPSFRLDLGSDPGPAMVGGRLWVGHGGGAAHSSDRTCDGKEAYCEISGVNHGEPQLSSNYEYLRIQAKPKKNGKCQNQDSKELGGCLEKQSDRCNELRDNTLQRSTSPDLKQRSALKRSGLITASAQPGETLYEVAKCDLTNEQRFQEKIDALGPASHSSHNRVGSRMIKVEANGGYKNPCEAPMCASHVAFCNEPPVARQISFRPNNENKHPRDARPAFQDQPGLVTPLKDRNGSNLGTLYAELRRLKVDLDARNEAVLQLKQELHAIRSAKDTATLSEQLRESERELRIWRQRAQWAETALFRQSKSRTTSAGFSD
ncbi:MAG: hypothetical protein Q9159_004867 [Coniocarpon cinnabarinum]